MLKFTTKVNRFTAAVAVVLTLGGGVAAVAQDSEYTILLKTLANPF